jgi:predicted cupin superfamily sugar epimerase
MDPVQTLSAAAVAERLGLQAHPEGGFFRETFRAAGETLTPRGPRAPTTGVLFLLTDRSPSRFHRLTGEELWIHQAGALVELLVLPAAGAGEESSGVIVLGPPTSPLSGVPDAAAACLPQALVAAAAWQAARVLRTDAGPDWSLVTCIVTPGFDFDDFELAERDALTRDYPAQAELIRALT